MGPTVCKEGLWERVGQKMPPLTTGRQDTSAREDDARTSDQGSSSGQGAHAAKEAPSQETQKGVPGCAHPQTEAYTILSEEKHP